MGQPGQELLAHGCINDRVKSCMLECPASRGGTWGSQPEGWPLVNACGICMRACRRSRGRAGRLHICTTAAAQAQPHLQRECRAATG